MGQVPLLYVLWVAERRLGGSSTRFVYVFGQPSGGWVGIVPGCDYCVYLGGQVLAGLV